MEDHFKGVEEYSIETKEYLSYHRFIPHRFVEWDDVNPDCAKAIKEYFDFMCNAEINRSKMMQKESILKSDETGIWFSKDTNENFEYYHGYLAFDYSHLSENQINEFFEKVCKKEEPAILKQMRSNGVDIALEGISFSPEENFVKYITVFRPYSSILDYFPELEKVDNFKKYIDINYKKVIEGYENTDPTYIKSPIRIQVDANDHNKISLEFSSPFMQRDFYFDGGIHDGYVERKNLYFDRMLEAEILSEEEVSFCKQKSPLWQQLSIKFKFDNNKLYDKKLYTFVVYDFEKIE